MRKCQGFSLTELAIVLLIVALLLGGMLMPLSAQNEMRNNLETQKTEQEIRDALIGYAVANGYLPCPAPADLSTAGAEATRNLGTGACPLRVGLVPWATLGLGRLDNWGHFYRYSVSPVYSNSGSGTGTKFGLASSGDIAIQTRSSAGTLVTLAAAVPAAVMSFGNNAAWAINENGAVVADGSATNIDEDTNGSGAGNVFVSRTATAQTTAAGGEFDDIVTWLPANILFNRMVAAGKLP